LKFLQDFSRKTIRLDNLGGKAYKVRRY